MSDMACICNLELLDEGKKLRKDILHGKALEVLLCIYEGTNGIYEIAKCLNLAVYSVQLYIKRLLKTGIIKEQAVLKDGCIEKKYELQSDDIELMECLKQSGSKEEIADTANRFAGMVKDAIVQAERYADEPNKVKAYFVKADEEKMWQFREKIDELFQTFKSCEDLEADNTYQLYSVFAPYQIESKEERRISH